mmetsp:Transcript_24130/g.39940  ORF Transcript_24130/g.39940 Transcript_24130/m.39940 type:complete len:357 (-) Transcript_24130:73-1143(-)
MSVSSVEMNDTSFDGTVVAAFGNSTTTLFGPLHDHAAASIVMRVPSSFERTTTTTTTTSSTTTSTNDLPTMRHFLAAGVASAVASAAFNPLDCLRVRWQLQSSSTTETSIIAFGRRIVREEGLAQGLWRPGVGANMIGMGVASSLRFGYYETIRNSLASSNTTNNKQKKKESWHMVVAGLVCGASAYFVTTPFHLMKTRLQAEAPRPFATNVWQGMIRIVAQTGQLSSLYKGSVPLSLRGSFFTAGQMIGYDGVKTIAKEQYGVQDGPLLHAMSSVSASFFASFFSAPADYVMARYMLNDSSSSVGECIRMIYKEGGVRAFWKGWSVFFVRLTPVLLTYSSVYEQLRYKLGLGYMN